MAPKRGGGKTEEERLMLQQQRAQAEEEKAKKEEESLTLFLEDKLQKEERNTEVNLLKLNEGWRSILRQSRAGELRGAVEVLSQTIERQRDVLNNVVKTVQRDLQGAELQWAQVRRVHRHQVERLRAQQHQSVTLLQQRETVLQQLRSSFISERERVSSDSLQRRCDVEDASFLLEQQHRAVMEEIFQLLNSIKQNSDEKDVRQTWDTAEQELKDLEREVKELKELKELKEPETEDQQLRDLIRIDKEAKKVKKMKETAVRLRDKLNNNNLEDERKAAITRNRSLQDQLTRGRAAVRKRLTELTVQSDAAARKLKAAIAKGSKVSRVAEMCRKQKRQLKDVPLVVPPEDDRQETTGPETDGPDKEMSALQQPMGKINTSVLQRQALRKRRDDLNRDNRQLRLLLRQRQDAMTVGGRHALLTVHRAPTSAAAPHADRRYNVIEGVHAAKHAL
ncbi:dynein regulatory complex subunit 2 [Lycodopsis pacificus]